MCFCVYVCVGSLCIKIHRGRQTDKETDTERKGSQSSNINISISEVERKKELISYKNRQMESYRSETGRQSWRQKIKTKKSVCVRKKQANVIKKTEKQRRRQR